MSGQWWESNLIVGPFSNITEANAWAAANPSSLFLGLLATSNGQQIQWRGAGVGWGIQPVSDIAGGIVHFIGDSITTKENGMTWAHQVIALSKGRFVCGVDAAVAGATIQDAIDVQVTKINAMVASEVWIQIGTNSPTYDVATEISKFDALYSAVKVAQPSAKIRIFGIPPNSENATRLMYTYAYNRALEEYAKSKSSPYSYGWGDCSGVDGGLSPSMRGDTTHPNLGSHRLCAGKRIADIFGAEPNTYSVPYTGSEADSLSVFAWASGLLTADTDANGVPDTFNNYAVPSSSATATLVNGVAPLFGKIFTRASVNASVAIGDYIEGVALENGKSYEIGFYYKQICGAIEAGSRIVIESTPGKNVWFYAGQGGFDIEGYYRGIIPASAHNGSIRFGKMLLAANNPFSASLHIGMIYLRKI